jgi:hypothetical protein
MIQNIHPVTLEEFGIAPSLVDSRLVLRLTGIGDTMAVTPLRDCLYAIKRGIAGSEVVAVEFDIRGMQLLNSSCLKVFATFLIELLGNKSTCPIRFIVDSKLPWQARSLFALERLASSLVRIVVR